MWCAEIPEICGYGIRIYGKSKKDSIKYLKKEFYGFRKAYCWSKRSDCLDFYTFKDAMEYFGGRVFEVKINENYFL